MKPCGLLAGAMAFLISAAHAQTFGVAVQVSNGKPVPTPEQLRIVLSPGGFVRDVFGWQKADRACNLTSNPGQRITIPAPLATLYQNVEIAGGRNFVTLAFNNINCGQPSNSGAITFPNTPALRAEFAAYAAGVAKEVPALGGISIWNELNGTWDGGYKTNRTQKLIDYCLLSNAVIREVRKVDPSIPIAIGATVGARIDQWFKDMFGSFGCMGKGDPTIWLDVHPYLSGKIDKTLHKIDWRVWSDSIASIRADRITNPLVGTEWGAKSAYKWSSSHPRTSYMKHFRTQVLNADPGWAGLMWFEMLYDKRFPNAGLLDANGSLTAMGNQYVAEFVH